MSDTTVVHLLRHGEVSNPRGVLYGQLPGYHLSEESGSAWPRPPPGSWLSRDVTVLRSSPLERALETAAPLAAQFGLDVEIDERLIEPWNHFEGTTFGVGDGALRRPANWRHLRNPFRPSWGEPYADIAVRMRAAMADAVRAAARARGGPRQPPAAHLGRPPARPRTAASGIIPAAVSARWPA